MYTMDWHPKANLSCVHPKAEYKSPTNVLSAAAARRVREAAKEFENLRALSVCGRRLLEESRR